VDTTFWLGLWSGLPIGIVAGVIANQAWEFVARNRANKAAKQLVGTWTAYDLDGRALSEKPMKGAGPTVVRSNTHWWSSDAGVLDFDSYDVADSGARRVHRGRIVIDTRVPWLATRIDRYEDSHEVAQQHLVISSDPSVVFVFPIPSGSTLGNAYSPHAWRKTGS